MSAEASVDSFAVHASMYAYTHIVLICDTLQSEDQGPDRGSVLARILLVGLVQTSSGSDHGCMSEDQGADRGSVLAPILLLGLVQEMHRTSCNLPVRERQWLRATTRVPLRDRSCWLCEPLHRTGCSDMQSLIMVA